MRPDGCDAVVEQCYKIRVTGLFQVEDLQGWLGRSTVPGHLLTVVLASFTSQHGLVELLRQLRSFGLGISEVRRAASSVDEMMADVAPGLDSAQPLLEALHDALVSRTADGTLVDLAIVLEWRGTRIVGTALHRSTGEQNPQRVR